MNPQRTFLIVVAATVLAALAVMPAPAQRGDRAEALFQAAMNKEVVEGKLQEAIKLYRNIVTDNRGNRRVAAKALMQIGQCYEKLGDVEARKAYEQLIRDFGDQNELVAEARSKLSTLGKRSTGGTPSMAVRRVHEGEGLDWCNALSSDGRHLIYTDWDTGDMAVLDLVTGQKRHLTNKGTWSASPKEFGECSTFSPDDKQIAFCWYDKTGAPEIRTIGLDGKDSRVLYRDEHASFYRPYDWSSDGKQILTLVVPKEGSPEIALLSASDGKLRVIRKIEARRADEIGMKLSPDSRYIAYSMPPESNSAKRDLFLMDTDGAGQASLGTHPSDDYLLGWAPDGQKVLFASDRSGSYAAWSVGVSGGRAQGSPELIKADFNKGLPVRLTPNGILYYALFQDLSDVYVASIDPDSGKLQGTPTAVKARYSGANAAPAWSPDGTRLAYRTNRGAVSGWDPPAMISILDINAGEERQIVPALDSLDGNDGPRWAPDGRSVLIIGSRGKDRGIYKVDLQSGATTPLVIAPPGQYILHAAWSPDAKSVFYPQGNPTRILRRDLETGRDLELASITGPVSGPRVAPSPDGKWLAFTSQDETQKGRKLNVVPVTGGEVREIHRAQDDENISSVNWTPDGRFVMFGKTPVRAGTPVRIAFWRVSPDGSNLQKLEQKLELGDYHGSEPRLHPDGRQIAFTSGQSKSALWALENFLPVNRSAPR